MCINSIGKRNIGRPNYLDDLDARYAAEALGLHVIGTIGILMRAKEQNLIPKIAPLLEQLIDAGIWISIEIKQYALEKASANP